MQHGERTTTAAHARLLLPRFRALQLVLQLPCEVAYLYRTGFELPREESRDDTLVYVVDLSSVYTF